MWAYLGRFLLTVAATALAYILTPKPKVKSPNASDIDIGRPEQGAIIGKPYGSPWCTPQIIWWGDVKFDAIREGGKK